MGGINKDIDVLPDVKDEVVSDIQEAVIANDDVSVVVENENETVSYDVKDTAELESEVEREAARDLIKQISYAITSLIPVLALFGYTFDWLTEDTVNLVATALITGVSSVITIYGIWKNHYSSAKAKRQKLALKQKGLK